MSRQIDPKYLELFRAAMDVLALAAAAQIASVIHLGGWLQDNEPVYGQLLYTCGILIFFTFSRLDLYGSHRGRPMLPVVLRLLLLWGLILLAGIILCFFARLSGTVSRLWIVYWFLIGAAFLIGHRLVAYHILHFLRSRYGVNRKHVALVGFGRTGQEMLMRATEQDWFGYQVEAIFADADELQAARATGIPCIEKLEEVPAVLAAKSIDEVWITLHLGKALQLERLQCQLRNCPVEVRLIPDTNSMEILSNRLGTFMGMLAVDLNSPCNYGMDALMKDVFDRVFALVAILLLLPLFTVCAVAIKLSSSGPVIFKQARHGLNGRIFWIYKFRTMRMHQEAQHNCLKQATRDDERVTPIGRFMRRTSIDELPQFFNVLKGEMSVVGPRPHAVQHGELYRDKLDGYMLRHRVKPGITGWAQIHGLRGETDTLEKMAERVRFDLYYIRNRSIWMDVRIIVWTAFKGWKGTNAY